jgi:uncharacterized protein (TIGR03435 family)
MMQQGFSCGVLAVGIVVACAAMPNGAQSPQFEAAAIRLSNDPPYMITGPGLRHGLLTATKVTLRRMVAVAYGMTEPRVIGPEWLDKDHFDIAGRAPKDVPDSELRPMLQALLKDRFQLATHSETREMPVYDLVVAKGGVKMPVYPAPERPLDDPPVRGFPMMRGTITTAQLADQMTFFVNRPVIDKTGLTERYNLFLAFAPLSPQTGDSAPEFGAPDLFTALQKQAGLKLEPGKDNLEVVVVDHMERMPTEN